MRLRFKRALTLIEIAISLSLIALIILPIYFTMAKSRETVAQSSEYRMARLAVQTVVERMRAQASSASVGPNSFQSFAADWTAAPPAPLPVINGGGAAQLALPASSQYMIAGLPPRADNGPHVVVTIATTGASLDETFVYQASNDGGINTAASAVVSLDDDDDSSGVAINGLYRAIPVTISVFWGTNVAQPKLTVTTLIAKPTDYMRENES
ncbi:MAG: hypothetical protein R3F62_27570 [Planctomycetota bacterium]